MTRSTLVRWGGAALAAVTLGFGLPALAGAGAGTASAQTAPAACSSATPAASATPSATPTATASPTNPLPDPLETVIASLSPRPASATPTASTSATPTATTTPCATPTATTSASATATATASATPTATLSAPPGAPQCRTPLSVTIDRAFVIPGLAVRVSVSGAAPGALVDLQAYSRPSEQYRSVRTRAAGADGAIAFDVTPGTNTRLFAQCVDRTEGPGQAASVSNQRVINVRTALSLTVVRNGTRAYTFQGRILPRRAGQLVTLYRVERNGTRVLTSQLKTDATGTYRIPRRFTGSGTFGFLTRTGQTLTNAAGESTSAERQRSAAYLQTGRGTPRPTAIF